MKKYGIIVEMGTNALHNVYVQPIKTWNDWRQMVRQLCKEKALQDKFDSIALILPILLGTYVLNTFVLKTV